jgi:hypothetical protein
MNIGDRVRVHIDDNGTWQPETLTYSDEGKRYTMGCAESLHGKRGTVIKIKGGIFIPGSRGNYIEETKFLVRFDTPPEKWWSNQRPSNGFWFSFQDLAED